MMCRSCRLLAGCFVAMVLIGCSGDPRLGKVFGRVTVGGKPVTGGTIMFHPDAGPTAVGPIGRDGAYTLTTLKANDGALVGSHRVTIHATAVGEGSMVDPKSFDEEIQKSRRGAKILVAGKVTWIVPEKYSRTQTSNLTATVGNRSNEINFDLPPAE